jgi:hypothetical protein
LKQAIVTRDALQVQGDKLAQDVAVLQNQLKATTELIQGHHWNTGVKPHDYVTLQNQVNIYHLILSAIFYSLHTHIHMCISFLFWGVNHIACLSVTKIWRK